MAAAAAANVRTATLLNFITIDYRERFTPTVVCVCQQSTAFVVLRPQDPYMSQAVWYVTI
jgi:hypothetical protein